MSLHHNPRIVTDGLVLALDAANPKSYPGSGTTWSDVSKSKNNATLINNPSFTSDNNGGIVFNGSNNYSRPNSPHSYLSSSSLGVTLKFNSYDNSKIVLFGYRHNTGYSNPTIGAIYIASGTFSASVITYTQVYRIVTGADMSVGEIYNIVLNKEVTTGNLDLYINGELSGQQTFDPDAYAQWTGEGSFIGADILDIGLSSNTTSSQGWVNYFNGTIYNANLYNRVLTAAEIKQNFNATRGRFGI